MNFKLVFLSLLALSFGSCKLKEPQDTDHPTETSTVADNDTSAAEEHVVISETDTVVTQVDSFKIYSDQLASTYVRLPPVYQHEIFEENEAATGKFSKLSKACNGRMKVLMNSSAVVSEMTSTIKAASATESDMVILIDRTASMGDHINKVKEGINQIIDTVKKYKGTRLAIATYGDKNYEGPWWFKFKNFETNYNQAAQYVKDIEIIGNPDWPESVYDAVMQCLQSDFWQSKKKCSIILVGDAPPQEKPYCDYTLEDVISASRERKVRMNFYPILILPEIRQVRISEEDKDKYENITGNTTLYPNPCRGKLTLTMEKTSTYYIEIYNMNGEIVVNDQHFGIIWQRDISDLPNGGYIARVINSDHTFELFKFILQH
ncbi:T9SS type A sorting domain-containing protein [Polluticoccus soli]|uniref:T9SS type A sorting domain-containing protein n=1 Tax=Polluticoccus soli TaxID=3034150 RepID=UPI0023E11F1D|nr:T9SS type A sorting domain-containing protein [Flavipsychrobacter sp. JY13-12]